MPTNMKRKKGATPVRMEDFYNPVTAKKQVQARPVDAHEQEYSKAKQYQNLGQSITGISSSAESLIKFISDKQEQQGMMAAMKGEEKPDTATGAFIRGYETFSGEADVAEFHKQLHAAYLESGDMTPDEWAVKREELTNKFLNGASDEYVRGFVPKALQVSAKYDQQITADQRKRVVNDHLVNVRKQAEEAYQFAVNLPEDSKDSMGGYLRKELTRIQKESKSLGLLDRNAVTEQFIQVIGRSAVREGRPDDLEELASAMAEPDKEDGFSLKNRPDLGEKIENYIDAAERTRNALDKAQANAEEKAFKARLEDIERAIVVGLADGSPESIKKVTDLINEHGQNIPVTRFKQYMNDFYDKLDDANWARSTDPFQYSQAYAQALRGKWNERVGVQSYLEKDDYIELDKINANAQKQLNAAGHSPLKKIEDLRGNLHQYLMTTGAKDMVGSILDMPKAIQRQMAVDEEINKWLHDLEQSETLGNITYEQIAAKQTEIIQKIQGGIGINSMHQFSYEGIGTGQVTGSIQPKKSTTQKPTSNATQAKKQVTIHKLMNKYGKDE